jgi:hypothetical protein
MMGRKVRLFTPVSAISLDALVPADHFYRQVDQVVDLTFVRELVQDRYVAGMGRPSVDPVVFFKLQLVMFLARRALRTPPPASGHRPAQRSVVPGVQLG